MVVEAPEGEKAKAAVAEAVSASSQQTSDDLESAPVEVLPVAKAEKPNEEKTSSPEDEAAVWEKVRLIRTKALALLESWSTLAEVFKIPRKVLRAEHEREAEEAEAAAHSRLSASENASASSGSPSISAVHMTENRKRSYERSRGDYHHHARPQVRQL